MDYIRKERVTPKPGDIVAFIFSLLSLTVVIPGRESHRPPDDVGFYIGNILHKRMDKLDNFDLIGFQFVLIGDNGVQLVQNRALRILNRLNSTFKPSDPNIPYSHDALRPSPNLNYHARLCLCQGNLKID